MGVMRLEYQSMAYHILGNAERSDTVLNEYIEKYGTQFPVEIASVYAWRGDVDKF